MGLHGGRNGRCDHDRAHRWHTFRQWHALPTSRGVPKSLQLPPGNRTYSSLALNLYFKGSIIARKSSAALATPATLSAARPAPPAGLPAPAVVLWNSICNALPGGFFTAGDLPLLASYCLAAHQKATADALVSREGLIVHNKPHAAIKVSMQLAGVMGALASKLGLCQSSRTRPESATLKKALATGQRPWEGTAAASPFTQ